MPIMESDFTALNTLIRQYEQRIDTLLDCLHSLTVMHRRSNWTLMQEKRMLEIRQIIDEFRLEK